MEWSPAQGTDTDGDNVTDRIRVEGNGLNLEKEVPGSSGYVLIDSADLQPGRIYTIRGERSDGFDIVRSDTISFTSPGTNGIELITASGKISCYPVPAGSTLIIEADFIQSVNLDIKILSLTGAEIFTTRTQTGGHLNMPVDLSDFTPGIYFLEVTAKDRNGLYQRQTRKIIKE